jgi:Alpha/beta-hydrolase family N-terminus
MWSRPSGWGWARGFGWSRQALESYLGPGASKRALARLVSAGLWAGGAAATYSAGVAYVGRANQRLEPGYATLPTSPLVSGSPGSLLPFADLGQQGRRYVTDVVTPELVEQVMGEPAQAHPIRTYVGFNSEPLYQAGRAELALAELERTGAFDRAHGRDRPARRRPIQGPAPHQRHRLRRRVHRRARPDRQRANQRLTLHRPAAAGLDGLVETSHLWFLVCLRGYRSRCCRLHVAAPAVSREA